MHKIVVGALETRAARIEKVGAWIVGIILGVVLMAMLELVLVPG